MIHPKDESFVNHTKTLANRRSPRFSVTSPYVGGLEVAVFFGSFSSAVRRNEQKPFASFRKEALSHHTSSLYHF